MPDQSKAFALEPDGGIGLRNPVGGEVVFKLRGAQSGGSMTVFETRVAPNEGPPLHFHRLHDEWLYVLRGQMRFRVGDDLMPASPGWFGFVPRGIVHAWQNTGRGEAAVLAGISPAGLERFFERYAALPAKEAGLEAFRSLGEEEDIIVVGPPLAQMHTETVGRRT